MSLTVNAAGSRFDGIDLGQKLEDVAIRSPTRTLPSERAICSTTGYDSGWTAVHIQRIFAVADAQETGGLLVRFGADAGNFVELLARTEAAVLVAVVDDIQRDSFGDPGDVAQQRPRGGVEIDADAVDAAFDGCLRVTRCNWR